MAEEEGVTFTIRVVCAEEEALDVRVDESTCVRDALNRALGHFEVDEAQLVMDGETLPPSALFVELGVVMDVEVELKLPQLERFQVWRLLGTGAQGSCVLRAPAALHPPRR